jgi:hypothetical protein
MSEGSCMEVASVVMFWCDAVDGSDGFAVDEDDSFVTIFDICEEGLGDDGYIFDGGERFEDDG